MALRRISFSWKPTISGRERWRWGLFMVVPSKSGRRSQLRIMVRGVLLWLAALSAVAYVAAATALFTWYERRPHNLVTWSDCLLVPLRWEEIQRKRGDAYIAEGLAAMEAMNWSEAVLKIQAGLLKSPDNRRGRERLGYFFIAAGQRERGLNLLIEGMERGYPGRELVETFVKICASGEDFALALRGLDACLAHSGATAQRDQPWLVEQKTRLLMVAQRYEEALVWIGRQPAMSDLLQESRVVALLSLQRLAEAKTALADWAGKATSAASSGALRLGVRLARESGELVEMRALLQRMKDRSPTDPSPWIYAVVQEWLAGEAEAAAAAQDTVFMRFETMPGILLRMAQPLVEIEAWPLYDRLATRARLLGLDEPGWPEVQLEAAIRRQRYDVALHLLESQPAPDESTGDGQRLALQRQLQEAYVRHLSTGETSASEELLQQLRRAPFALPLLKSMAEAHQRAGYPVTALQLLEVARQRYPGSVDVRERADRLREVVGDAERITPELPMVQDGTPIDLETVEVSRATVSSDNSRLLGSARLFLERCDELIAARGWGDLERLLRELRQQRPPWMSAVTGELLEREIELNLGQRDWPALVTNVRFRLDGTLNRALEVMNVVRRLDANGERSAAERVLTEVERRYPDFAPAKRQRADWEQAAGNAAGAASPAPVN